MVLKLFEKIKEIWEGICKNVRENLEYTGYDGNLKYFVGHPNYGY